MAVKIQHLRSSTADKRPTTTALLDGELSINTNAGSAGVFFEDAAGGIVKVGPTEVGATAPNVTPPSGGSAGNSTGEFWFDTANAAPGNGEDALKIYTGAAWAYIGAVTIGSTNVVLGAAATTTIAGLTSITSADINATTSVDLDNQADLRFYEATANGSNYVGFQAPAAITADVLWTLPGADGSAGQVLSTNGSGTLAWAGTTGNTISQGDSSVVVTDSGSNGTITFATDNSNRWAINNLGHLVPFADSTYNIGAAANEVSNIFVDALTAGSVNKVTITAPATGSTLTIADGKTLTASNTLTFTGTDASSVAFGTGGTVAYTANKLSVFAATTSAELAGVISDETGSGALVFATSPSLTTPSLGVASATSVNKVAITAPATSATLTIANGKTLTASNTLTFTGTDASSVAFGTGGTVAYTANKLSVFAATTSSELAGVISDETGSGLLVFGTSPSLTTPALAGETFSTTNNVTAGTDAQGQGALTTDYNVVTTAAASPSGVTLPTATAGRRIVIVNKGANAINVFPATGAAIDAVTANGSVQIPVGGVAIFNASSTTQWYSTLNLSNTGVTVSSFSAGTTGLTPSTATTGAVTLGGTLAVANGGTGQTTYTNGQLLIGNTTGSTLTKATLTQGTGIAITNGSGSISIAVAASVPTSIATGSGTVTPATNSFTIAGGTGINTTGATSTVTVTLANTAVTPSSYGSGSQVATFTVDAQGRLTAAANSNISITASQVSDFNTAVQTNRLDQMAAPTASVSLNSQLITNLLDPVSAQDAATKNYVDSVAQGLDVKASCLAATTTNITLSGAQTIDGVSVTAGNRVLVKNQSTASQNGIYVAAAGAWARSSDADTIAKLVSAFVFVEEGTANADNGYVCTTNAGGTLGSTAITWEQFSGAGQITAGDGLSKTGNTLNVNPDSRAAGTKTIAIVSDEVRIDTGYVGQTSLTTLGTITTGTWNGTAIGLAYGGTGASNTGVTQNYAFLGPNTGGAGNASFREILTSDIAPITGGSFDSGTF